MADFEHNKANLGAATLSSAITSSQTSITVDASDASTFPSTPFYATISPIGETPNLLNAEIVKVTAISSGTLTVARGQRSTTAKAFAAGSVIFNGVYTQDLDYAQAVGRAFFTASYSAGVFYINNAMLPTTPTDGMSIRVIFSQDVTAGAVGVSLNNGTTYNVYAGAAITSSHGSATTNPQVKSGIIYELVFYNGAWYVMNLPANESITSNEIDPTTTGCIDFLYSITPTDIPANPASENAAYKFDMRSAFQRKGATDRVPFYDKVKIAMRFYSNGGGYLRFCTLSTDNSVYRQMITIPDGFSATTASNAIHTVASGVNNLEVSFKPLSGANDTSVDNATTYVMQTEQTTTCPDSPQNTRINCGTRVKLVNTNSGWRLPMWFSDGASIYSGYANKINVYGIKYPTQ